MSSLYSADGWVDASRLMDDPAPVVIATGGRGIGKTYGVLKEFIKRDIFFLYMRRQQIQIESALTEEFNPFHELNTVEGYDILSARVNKAVIGFYHSTVKEGKAVPQGSPIGLGVALSVFANIRGISGDKITHILFDEIIPERQERPIKAEGSAILNAYESINRNRELNGIAPLKLIMLTNSNQIDSGVLDAFGAIDPLDKMIRKGQSYSTFYEGNLAIYRYTNSPISEAKKHTALYKLSNIKEFSDMAIDNDFSENDFEQVRGRPIGEYRPLVSIGGVTIYKHKSRAEYYIVRGVKTDNIYTLNDNSKTAFRKEYYYLYIALIENRVSFSDVKCKMIFEGVFKNK